MPPRSPSTRSGADESAGPVPEANRPGHHPEVEQDKPSGPPPRPAASIPRTTRFPFHFERSMVVPALAVGVMPRTAEVVVGEEDLRVRFGPWSLRTPLANVDEVTVTGPYSWLKVAGPPHLSLSDGGLTFATSTRAGACVRFRRRVPVLLPSNLLRHPAVTVTVEDPEAFARELRAAVRRAS
ncbi:MAG TPA: hypothetical protein VEW93_07850 [Acidimicrobiales bacterium]|nr:hypothetical protein [Acidimicrobiales bacterium]